jgi:hypothetical protein
MRKVLEAVLPVLGGVLVFTLLAVFVFIDNSWRTQCKASGGTPQYELTGDGSRAHRECYPNKSAAQR